jgi:hypothetical protein
MSPPDDERRRRPGGGGVSVEANDVASLPRQDAWWVLHQASCVVEIEALAQEAMSELTSAQLKAILWIGLVDEGWERVRHELHRRGDPL